MARESRGGWFVTMGSLWLLASPLHAGTDFLLVGYEDLIARLGLENTPDGAEVEVGQVEALANGNYSPNTGNVEFIGKTFTLLSGPSGNSNHATNVGKDMYGNLSSIAPGTTTIYLYESADWLFEGYLNVNGGAAPPADIPGALKIFNNSWVGELSPFSANSLGLRRADFAITRDDVIIVNGVNNDEPADPNDGQNQALMSHTYNGLAVGVRDGTHTSDTTLAGVDGAGRLKPELVAPGNATSFAAPIVAAAAAVLVETARTEATAGLNPHAERSEVIKAILLAAATHEDAHGEPWTNNPDESGPSRGVTGQPIDAIVGAGTVNINLGHLILTAGEQDGSELVPTAPNAAFVGWDLANMGIGESQFWRFELPAAADEVSIAATWHRHVGATFANFTVADLTLTLWRVDDAGGLATLVGDAGLDDFAGGNVVSQSAIDNVEHLFITGLEQGEYVIELARVDAIASQPEWDIALAWRLPEPPLLLGDLDGNGDVNGADLGILLLAWGSCPAKDVCPADFNGDGEVDGADLGLLLLNWTG